MQDVERLREDCRYVMVKILQLDPVNGPIVIYNITQEVLHWASRPDTIQTQKRLI